MRKTFQPGDVIIREGEPGVAAYFINSGRLEVSRLKGNVKTILAIMGKGELFGEMSMIDDRPRAATVIALEETELTVIDRDHFNDFFYGNPDEMTAFLKNVFERLRHLDQAVVNLSARRAAMPTSYFGGPVLLSGSNPLSEEVLGCVSLELKKFPFKIGRQTDRYETDIFANNDLYLKDTEPFNVSRNHLEIQHSDKGFFVIDRGSTLGTIVNGERIGGPVSNVEIELPSQTSSKIIVGTSDSPYKFSLRIP